jgi:hypothetical protein
VLHALVVAHLLVAAPSPSSASTSLPSSSAVRPGARASAPLPRDPQATSAVDVDDPPLFALRDVRPGQKGYGYTVFSTRSGPEEFSFEVLGILRGYLGPGEDLIIAKLSGAQIERTGVIAGMSGSPAYIDGKLVGAVGYRFGQFTKDPIAGITPIERMLTGAPVPTATASSQKPVLVDTPWGRAEPIAVPLVAGGLSGDVLEAFSPLLRERGYGAVLASGGASSSTSSSPPVRFFPAGPIAGLLVDGDLTMAGIGTVTWVKGDRFLAFGHPFLGTGMSEMPVSNAEIVTTVASDAGSWKMGQATAPVGRLTDDRLHAIAGTMGDRPQTVPVNLRFDLPGPRRHDDQRPLAHFFVARHKTDTPMFCALALANALQDRVSFETGGTFDVVVDAQLSTGDRVTLPTRVADRDAGPALPTAFFVLSALNQVVDTDFAAVEVTALDVSVTGRPEVDRARIVSAVLLGQARAGDKIPLLVRLQPVDAPAREVRIEVAVPAGLAPGAYTLVVAGDSAAARVEREGGLWPVPQSFADELALLRSMPPPGSLSVYLRRDEPLARVGGRSLPGAPRSLVELIGGAGGLLGAGVDEDRVTRLHRTFGSGVVVGEASARLLVSEDP